MDWIIWHLGDIVTVVLSTVGGAGLLALKFKPYLKLATSFISARPAS